MKWFLMGLLLGAGMILSAQSLPGQLLNGRTTGGVNVPFLVATDGTLQTQ